MKPKVLTEREWKVVAGKNNIKDNGLQRALAQYEDADEDDHAAQLAGIAKVNQLAAALQRNKDVAGNEAVVDYLDEIQEAADAEQKEIGKAKTTADRAAAAAEKQEKEEENYQAKLGVALQKLKSSRGLSYEFLLCDAQDGCAVILAPAISAQRRQQLMRVAGGRRLVGPGTCRFEDGKYVFATDRPVSGMVKKLQAALLEHTGRRLPVVLGDESAEGEE